MIIDKSVVKTTPLCCYGFIIFLVTNVYMLWGVALPSSEAMTLADYDALILTLPVFEKRDSNDAGAGVGSDGGTDAGVGQVFRFAFP